MAVDVHAEAGGVEGAAWDDMEERFFAEQKRKQQREDDHRELEFVERSAALNVRLENCQREKWGLEKRLRGVEDQIAQLEDEAARLNDEYQLEMSRVRLERSDQRERMHNHFQSQRSEGPIDLDLVNQMQTVGATVHHRTPAAGADTNMAENLTGAVVVDSEGDLIGPIMKIPAHNHWIDIMLDLDIKRKVVILEGRKFTKANLDVVYEKTDAKCSKWIACMIQATGITQSPPCASCHASLASDRVFAGPFASCVKAQGSEFVKCGNCEWNKTPCHASASEPSSHEVRNGAHELPMMMDIDGGRIDGAVNTIVHRALAPTAAPLSLTPSASTGPMPRPATAWTPAGAASAAPMNSPYFSGNSAVAATAPGGGAGPASAANSPPASDDTPELTEQEKEELVNPPIVMRHDGRVYTYPDFMEGVPLEKIDPTHPYWDHTWKEPIQATQTVLTSYEEKHADALKKDVKNSKFLLGRQVRRGHSIIRYLREGSISPYQLVSKKYMVPSLVTYDTLFRLINTIEELEKFKISVTPVDWLRHRLYEHMLAQGDKFNLAKTVKDLYHDEKLGKLRKLSGFGNIGRPSGGKDAGPRARRRESINTPTRPYRKRPKTLQQPVSAETRYSLLRTESLPLPSEKIVRPGEKLQLPSNPLPLPSELIPSRANAGPAQDMREVQDGPKEPDEFEYDGYTDTDSLSGENVYKDDFHLVSIRTAKYKTKEDVDTRVYWHSEGGDIDVQVCTQKEKAWLAYDPPVDFMASFSDFIEVNYHPDSLKVLATIRSPLDGPSGSSEIAACLARDRTKKRLLGELRDQGIAIKATTS